MTTTNVQKLREELVVFLRNSDIIPIATRGVTTATETFSGTGGALTITLTNNIVRNIRSVIVGATTYKAYVDYTPTYGTSATTIAFITLPGAGTNNISVSYDYSAGFADRIWPDFPEITFLVNESPKIGFEILDRTQVMGLEGNYLSDATAFVRVYDLNAKSLDGYHSAIRSAVKNASKSFYNAQFVFITNTGPLILHSELAKKVFEREVQLMLRFRYEA